MTSFWSTLSWKSYPLVRFLPTQSLLLSSGFLNPLLQIHLKSFIMLEHLPLLQMPTVMPALFWHSSISFPFSSTPAPFMQIFSYSLVPAKDWCRMWRDLKDSIYPVDIYMFKANNRNTKTRCEICSKLTIKIPKRRHWRRSGAFIVNFEHTHTLF